METNFTLAAPPRRIPLFVQSKIYFGGMINQIGWAIFLFGILTSWAFGVDQIFKSWYQFSGTLDHTEGLVIEVGESAGSEGNVPVMQMDYVFDVDGREYKGRSYFTGEFYEKGSKVEVEYAFMNPEYSRISGLRSSLFGAGIVFVLLFPLIGFIMVLTGITIGRKTVNLLKNGKPVFGKLVKKSVSNISVNNVPLDSLTFEYSAEDSKAYSVSLNKAPTHHLQVDSQQRMLYNPKAPRYARLLDDLPGSVILNSTGNFQRRENANLFTDIIVLILPVFTLYILFLWLF
ncbi:DUF3592 domain-containing protein [candidate division KSB1 bacterium]|nr:DUF3592 domain-containing protein [candidate division KSB1 bacterium]